MSEPATWWRRHGAWLRPALLFVITFAVLAGVAGRQLQEPSANNHFVHMASGWLEGRLEHDGRPPGYCDAKRRRAKKCRYHSFDDWAVLRTLQFADGSQQRGYPCRTSACAEASRTDRVETWYIVGDGWRSFPKGTVRRVGETWYVSFPPGPALLLLPFVAIWGLGTLDVLLTALLAALLPALLVRTLDRIRGSEGRTLEHSMLALALGLGSPACFLGANGSVWFTAQICGALLLTAYLDAAWDTRAPTRAGLWLGLAVACRPTMALAVVFFGWEWWRNGRRLQVLIRFVGPVLLVGAGLMWFNLARFEDPFEFGHRFLEIRWQARMQEYGLFSTRYLARNLQCMLWLLPQVSPLRFSLHGSAIWLLTPWVLSTIWARARFPQRAGLWLTMLALMTPVLLYQNSGQTQFTYRFAMLWLPVLALLVGCGGGVRYRRRFGVLVLISVVAQVWGAWMFAHDKAHLFVQEPLGWPFQAEFEQP